MYFCVGVCVRACVGARAFPRELMIITRPRAVRAWFNTVAVAAHERLISVKQCKKKDEINIQ